MGTGSSVQPKQGVLPNPRMQYAKERGKKSKMDYQIGAPVLIDLNHGSIRYRYDSEQSSKKEEKPFEGDATQKKGHYFYHPRLNDFSSKASAVREDPQKFLYVVKGPVSAKDKKVFYVYGQSFDAKDGQLTRPMATAAMGPDPTWPQRQKPNDVYYNLTFIKQVPTEDPIPGIPNRYQMQFALNNTDIVNDLKKKIALTIIKSSANVHVCFHQKTLRLIVLKASSLL
ncbi:uncharacterized protein LOC123524475 isoform X2 [Mercenaria mercenaria]|uniref:uncharacterized protein LOC123524475 isoform X2 n=1 Tax=Mercenaria mercenaria TaxID=6596 RepID=UPI00234E9BFE|nr:uncharacterized protein LOC123524475 isoform X2 [Mercenaria mercenaria]